MSAARRWVWNDVLFTSLVAVMVGLTYTPLADPLNGPLCAVSYRGAAWLLDILGVPHTADAAHRVLRHGSFAIEVSGLCSGLRALALWGAVMILLPAPRRQKLVHFVVGVLGLMLVNIVRIVHLFTIIASSSSRFEFYHHRIWPMAIATAILLYRLLVRITPRGQHLEAARA